MMCSHKKKVSIFQDKKGNKKKKKRKGKERVKTVHRLVKMKVIANFYSLRVRKILLRAWTEYSDEKWEQKKEKRLLKLQLIQANIHQMQERNKIIILRHLTKIKMSATLDSLMASVAFSMRACTWNEEKSNQG